MRRAAAALAATAAGVALIVGVLTGSGGGAACGVVVSGSSLGSVLAGAVPGGVVCLGSGDYVFPAVVRVPAPGVTLTSAPGARVTVSGGLSFSPGDWTNVTVDGTAGGGSMTVTGESDWEGASSTPLNLRFQNLAFTASIVVTGIDNGNITLTNDSFNNFNENGCTGQPARIHLAYNDGATPSGITVEHSTFIDPPGGEPNAQDGIQTGEGLTIKDNLFENLLDNGGCNHIDSIQGVGATGIIATGNLFINDYDGIVDYDTSTRDTITNNACEGIQRGGGPCASLYGDLDSTLTHNTAAPGDSILELGAKPGQRTPTGTTLENNLGPPCPCTSYPPTGPDTHNLYPGASTPNINATPTLQAATPTTWNAFQLTPTSPGHNAATDNTNIGITTTPTP